MIGSSQFCFKLYENKDFMTKQTDQAVPPSGVPRNFFRGAVQQIQLRTDDREDGDLEVVVP